ncbi:MAG: FAD-dependent oxidoreductase, partial [Chloroflexi bacterium]|nr:FAD-dependent oxidoreductase [Chloroflexota bacterium]
VTVTGGKLTIFEIMAEDALKAAMPQIGKRLKKIDHWFDPIPESLPQESLDQQSFHYLAGRYGQALPELVNLSEPEDLQQVDDLYVHWAELVYNARYEMVEHLDDLLLRRTRLGMLLPDGAMNEIDRVKALTQNELPWSQEDWQNEISRYQKIYLQAYSPDPENHLK